MTYFVYDPTSHGFLQAALRCSRAVFPVVLQKPGYWFFVLLNAFLWCALKFQLCSGYAELFQTGGLLKLDQGHFKISTGLLTFFLVFYTSQCYARYFSMGTQVQDLFQTSMKCILEHKVYFCKAEPELCRTLARWMQASLLITFKELMHCKDGVLGRERWDELVNIGALRQDEVDIISQHRLNHARYTLLHWMMCITSQADAVASRGPPVLKGVMDRIIHFHDAQRLLWYTFNMPVPWVYFHLVNAMVSIQGFLGAISMAETPSLAGPIAFQLSFALFVGMLEVATKMSVPFGEEDVDFPIQQWFQSWSENQVALVEQTPKLADFSLALQQAKKQPVDPTMLGSFLARDDLAEKEIQRSADRPGTTRLLTVGENPTDTPRDPSYSPIVNTPRDPSYSPLAREGSTGSMSTVSPR